VFDASATYQGRSLNTETLPGPKLQSNIFDILVRFRKELVALAGDVSQMYHQLVLQPVDRPFHRVLWQDLDPRREPETYELQRFVLMDATARFAHSTFAGNMHVITKTSIL